jgi:hypothetical protein
MSYKVEINAAGDPPDSWVSNALRFSSWDRADKYGLDLMWRWTAVKEYRVVESTDPIDEGRYSDTM